MKWIDIGEDTFINFSNIVSIYIETYDENYSHPFKICIKDLCGGRGMIAEFKSKERADIFMQNLYGKLL